VITVVPWQFLQIKILFAKNVEICIYIYIYGQKYFENLGCILFFTLEYSKLIKYSTNMWLELTLVLGHVVGSFV
jgi:hypothetical protein